MRRQPAQMSTLVAACASSLHSASCAVNKSINRRAYASVYVRIRPYAEQRVGPRWTWSAFLIGWNACAGLRWPWKFSMFSNFDGDIRHVSWAQPATEVYTAAPTVSVCARIRAYARVYMLMEYKPGFTLGFLSWLNTPWLACGAHASMGLAAAN